ncbi:TonB-dependent receptor [Lysobacter silvisoli]|uniref:TonB-dependent receptor n=1 Tax=Lysobacter silvisoli TaxID=2293254 RepID=A0A371K0U1_9GAMM|nr:TonB-dependent receptor [Lysobacter silvisoli]RDZ27536.1 TonB-dependent receptor [Lysobacter silvisoli]
MKNTTTTVRRRRHPMAAALATALGLSLLGAAPLATAQQAAAHQFALPSQPLGDALNRLAEAAGVQILVPPDLVRGRTAPQLAGKYTVNQALDKVLVGSGLTHRSTRAGVITVVRAAEPAARPAPRPAAKPVAKPAAAEEPLETTEIATVEVTGSRIKRAEIEGPSPVTIISAEQIENEGHATVFEALESLVMASGAVETELSGGFSANAHPLNLRGLGPGRSLLLINGRRAADYPFPYEGRSNFQNFGNIPSGAVERIEVLAGGASAIYGADAVSGVVNVVLKRDYQGDTFKLRAGTSGMGGRDRVDAQWTGGRIGEHWSLTYALQYYNQELLYGFQRDGWDLRKNPAADRRLGVEPTAALRIRRGGTSSSNPLIALPAGTCARWGGEFTDWTYRRISGGNVQALGNACGSWNDPRYVHLSKGKNEAAAYVFGNYDFSERLEGWASVQVWDAKAESLGGFESITGPHTDGVGRRGDFFDPQFNAVIAPTRLLTPVDLGGVEDMNQHYKERSFDLAVGLRGQLGDRFDWDATLSRAEYDFERTRRRMVGNKVNEFFFGPQLGTRPNGTPIHRLNLERWLRPLTPAEYASISTLAKYQAESWVSTGSFVLSGDLFELPAGPLGMAAILEASRQGYRLDSDPRVQPGVVQLYNLTGTNGGGERDRYAAGIEFSLPITQTLKASLAGRFDKYDDITAVDDAKTWNAGLEWRPTDSLLIRGSYATSFKAPDLHWVFSEGSGSFGSATDTWRCIAAGANPGCSGYGYTMFTVTEGDPNLEEETGKSWSAGLVWDIAEGLSVNADYWNIELNGALERISSTSILADEAGCRTGKTLSGQPFGFAGDSAYCQLVTGLVTRTPEDGQSIGRVTQVRSLPINQSFRRVAGIDAGLNWRIGTERYGRYNVRLNWSHTLKSERQVLATDRIEGDWRDDEDNLDFRSRVTAGLDWRRDAWSASLFTTRYGSLPKFNGQGRTGVHFLWNANVGKRITDKAELKFYVNNLFNSLHPHDETNSSFPYFYEVYSPVGREFALQFEYKLD